MLASRDLRTVLGRPRARYNPPVMSPSRCTIVVPYFNTPRMGKVCLRALRKFTPRDAGHEVVVINNGSTDGSEEYFRELPWIRFIDRKLEPEELGPIGPDDTRSRADRGGLSHGRAINLAWRESDAPYFLTIHSDTIVKRPNWLEFLVRRLESRPGAFATGSWKLERTTRWKTMLKEAGDVLSTWVNSRARERRRNGTRPFLRSHCALYRRADLEKEALEPFDGGATTCGQGVHYAMVERGYAADFIPPWQLIHYLDHINHGTMVINPELGASDRSIRKGMTKLDAFYAEDWVRSIEQDDSLDT